MEKPTKACALEAEKDVSVRLKSIHILPTVYARITLFSSCQDRFCSQHDRF